MSGTPRRRVRGIDAAAAARERHLGRLAGVAGLGSVGLTLFAILIGARGAVDGPAPGIAPSSSQALTAIYDTPSDQVLGNTARDLGLVLASLVALFLYSAARRRGAGAGSWVIGVIIAGTILYAVDFWVGYAIVRHAALRFHDSQLHGTAASHYASHLLHSGIARWLPLIDIGMRVAFGAWLLIVSYYAFAVGLLSRALAVWGAGSGLAIPFLAGGDTIFLGWLLVTSALIFGLWPGGRPPAWDTVPRMSLDARLAK